MTSGEKVRKRWLMIVIGWLVSGTVLGQYAGGTGDPCDPFLTATAEQLVVLGTDPDN